MSQSAVSGAHATIGDVTVPPVNLPMVEQVYREAMDSNRQLALDKSKYRGDALVAFASLELCGKTILDEWRRRDPRVATLAEQAEAVGNGRLMYTLLAIHNMEGELTQLQGSVTTKHVVGLCIALGVVLTGWVVAKRGFY